MLHVWACVGEGSSFTANIDHLSIALTFHSVMWGAFKVEFKTKRMAWPQLYVILSCCAGKFFWYVFFMFIILFFFTCYGMTVVAVVPNIQVIIVTTPTTTTAFSSVVTRAVSLTLQHTTCDRLHVRLHCNYSPKAQLTSNSQP